MTRAICRRKKESRTIHNFGEEPASMSWPLKVLLLLKKCKCNSAVSIEIQHGVHLDTARWIRIADQAPDH